VAKVATTALSAKWSGARIGLKILTGAHCRQIRRRKTAIWTSSLTNFRQGRADFCKTAATAPLETGFGSEPAWCWSYLLIFNFLEEDFKMRFAGKKLWLALAVLGVSGSALAQSTGEFASDGRRAEASPLKAVF